MCMSSGAGGTLGTQGRSSRHFLSPPLSLVTAVMSRIHSMQVLEARPEHHITPGPRNGEPLPARRRLSHKYTNTHTYTARRAHLIFLFSNPFIACILLTGGGNPKQNKSPDNKKN